MAFLGCCWAQSHRETNETLLQGPNPHHVGLLQPPPSQSFSYAAHQDRNCAHTETFPQHDHLMSDTEARLPLYAHTDAHPRSEQSYKLSSTDKDAVPASMSTQAISGLTHVPNFLVKHTENHQDDCTRKESQASVYNMPMNHVMPYLVCNERPNPHVVDNTEDANNAQSSQHQVASAQANRTILPICPALTQGDLKSEDTIRSQLEHGDKGTSKLYPLDTGPAIPNAFIKEDVKHTSALEAMGLALTDALDSFGAGDGSKEEDKSDMQDKVDGSVSTSQKVDLIEDDLKKKDPPLVCFWDEEVICPTCLDGYDEENPKIDTTCGHHYHLGCILEWAERSPKCPMCDKILEF